MESFIQSIRSWHPIAQIALICAFVIAVLAIIVLSIVHSIRRVDKASQQPVEMPRWLSRALRL